MAQTALKNNKLNNHFLNQKDALQAQLWMRHQTLQVVGLQQYQFP